ncbi:MAG: hypothetical protein WKF70_09355, partial [Chitinophagaceae bacterium]
WCSVSLNSTHAACSYAVSGQPLLKLLGSPGALDDMGTYYKHVASMEQRTQTLSDGVRVTA